MTIHVDIPEYDGGWIEVLWENQAKYKTEISHNDIVIYGNKAAFYSLARQMLYFCFNDIPPGSHVHFDDFFCKHGCFGPELIIGLLNSNDLNAMYYNCFTSEIGIEIPDCADNIVWYDDASIVVESGNQQVSLQGNQSALYALAKQLLILYNSCIRQITPPVCYYSNQLQGWKGLSLEFQYLSE